MQGIIILALCYQTNFIMPSTNQASSVIIDSLKHQYTVMKQSAMTVQTTWQNALYINKLEYSSILIIYHYRSYWIIFTIYT